MFLMVGLLHLMGLLGSSGQSTGGHLQIRDGYFWNPETGNYFLARGPAYQSWNPPVFANQSFDQIAYDLRQFVKMRANSVRAELVWGELEIADGVYDWTRADFLVKTAEELGLKLFLLIGYQYPPKWFPEAHRCINDRGERSDVLNYESAEAQTAYAEHMAAVVARYKDSTAIGAWIIGNEFAYFDLWEDPGLYPARRMLGYNPISQAAFRQWLAELYDGEIETLNERWGTNWDSFDEVEMPQKFPADRNDPGYHDLIQWRKQSIAKFLARGSKAVRENDPNHLISYSMVGGIFSGSDANHTCEDPVTIVEHCEAAEGPLDFWSVNNYAWATEGSELRTADFGIAKYQDLIGLPIMISETGHTSTEDLLPGAGPRQPLALPSTLWEAFTSGAVGIHFFHWNDRNNFTEDYFIRERGFGIVHQNRKSKGAVFDNIEAMLRRMDEIDFGNLLGGSTDPSPDVVCYLTTEGDIGFPRGNQENTMIWGALRRLGYQVALIFPEQVMAGEFRGAQALALSRCEQMKPELLDRIQSHVLPSGINVHANADLPGQFDAYRRPNPNWAARTQSIFGLNVRNATAEWDSGVSGGFNETYRTLNVRGAIGFGSLPANYHEQIQTWKIWHGVTASAGSTILTHDGLEGEAVGTPALQFRNHGAARAAATTYALGDTHSPSFTRLWDMRSDVIGAIYRDWFGITPKIRLSGNKAQYVVSDYRICRNGSMLLSLLNEHESPVSLTLHAPELLEGKTVENLSGGGIVEANSDGLLRFSMTGDEFLLLYVYDEDGGPNSSLIQDTPYRVWFEEAPQSVWPSVNDFSTMIGFDTRDEDLELVLSLESVNNPRNTYGRSGLVAVRGQGKTARDLSVRDADGQLADYRSTPDGGQHQLRASLEKNGVSVAETTIAVQMLWGVRPTGALPTAEAGESYEVELEWEELPGYLPDEIPTSIDRAQLFDSVAGLAQHYNIVLQVRDEGANVVASSLRVTREATSSATFQIDVPSNASGPLHWFAYTQPAPGATRDVIESFEGWTTGEAVPFGNPEGEPNPEITNPWLHYTYTHLGMTPQKPFYLNHGVHIEGSDGSQSVFCVVHNHAGVGDYSGFGLRRILPERLVLPDTPEELAKFRFSFDFREHNAFPSRMELQIKDAHGAIIFLAKDYEKPAGDWETVTGNLSEFRGATWLPVQEFDYSNVTELVCNISLREPGEKKFYQAEIDNIRFDGPELLVETEPIDAYYDSRNDSLPDLDGDGIVDALESGSGVFNGVDDPGTSPHSADSDGDGQSDGAELVAGTNPNAAGDQFKMEMAENEEGDFVITWPARTGRRYAVEFSDVGQGQDDFNFTPMVGIAPIEVAEDGMASVTIARPAGVSRRFYRVVGWMK